MGRVPVIDDDLYENRVIGENICRLRQEHNWSQTEFAERVSKTGLHWTRSVVHRVEKEFRPLLLSEALRVAQVFEVDIVVLLTDDSPELRKLSQWLGGRSPAAAQLAAEHLNKLFTLLDQERSLTNVFNNTNAAIEEVLQDMKRSL